MSDTEKEGGRHFAWFWKDISLVGWMEFMIWLLFTFFSSSSIPSCLRSV